MTIKDIARLANVSPSTVSKIINGKADNIRPATRENVLNIVRQYHYSPSNFIRQSGSARTYQIGLLLNRSFYNTALLQGITDTARTLGYYPLICHSGGDKAEEDKFLAFLSNKEADGILWERVIQIPGTHPLPDGMELPCLLLNDVAASAQSQIDYAAYGRLAALALVDQGHSRIAFIAGEDGYQGARLFDGVRRCLISRMISVSTDDYCGFTAQTAIELLKDGYTAAICTNGRIASALSQQLSKLLCFVPQDFSIVTLTSEETNMDPALSSVAIPYREYGEFLIHRLIQAIDHDESFSSFAPLLPQEVPLSSIAAPKNSPSKHIVVVGSIHMDININSDDLPQLGKTVSVKSLSMIPGGKGVNQAVGVAKLRKEVHLIGRIGSDFDGVVIQDALSKNQVHTEGIVKDETDTGRAFIYILENGESAITYYDGANTNLSISDISNSSHLFRNAGFCLLQTEIPMETVVYAAKLAKRNKAKIILKPAAITEISDDLLSMTDYFVPNEKEIDTLFPGETDCAAQCERLLQKGVKTVILTLGSRGCYLHRKGDTRYFPASGHAATDTTGGSDAFISALVTYLSENVGLYQAIRYAIYAAGFCVSRQGVVPALIDRDSLELYRKQEDAKLTPLAKAIELHHSGS